MGAPRIGYPHTVVALNGSPSYLGTIDATTTSKTNHQATTPFNNTGDGLSGKVLLIQSNSDVFLLPVSTNTGTVTTTTGVKIRADERVMLTMTQRHNWLAVICASGTANVRIWEME